MATMTATIDSNFETSTTKAPFHLGRTLLFGLFAVVALASAMASLHPELRTNLRAAVLPETRTIVSTARGDLLGTGSMMTVAKIKMRNAVALEIYESQEDGSQRMVERIVLPNAKDGYFNFNGAATNLAIDDINGDGRPEILAPTFDQNLVGQLNVYQYDQGAKTFISSLQSI